MSEFGASGIEHEPGVLDSPIQLAEALCFLSEEVKPDPFWICFDNLESVQECSEIAGAVVDLIAHGLPFFQVALTTRQREGLNLSLLRPNQAAWLSVQTGRGVDGTFVGDEDVEIEVSVTVGSIEPSSGSSDVNGAFRAQVTGTQLGVLNMEVSATWPDGKVLVEHGTPSSGGDEWADRLKPPASWAAFLAGDNLQGGIRSRPCPILSPIIRAGSIHAGPLVRSRNFP